MYESLEPEDRVGLHHLREQGLSDKSEQVRQEHLASMGNDLVVDVASTVDTLIRHQAHAKTIERVLVDAWRIEEEWLAELDRDDASQVIRLIIEGDWTEWIAQNDLVKLAPLHLGIILDSIKDAIDLRETSRHSIDHELRDAFRQQPTVVPDWLIREIQAGTKPETVDSILEIFGDASLSQPLGDAIAVHVLA